MSIVEPLADQLQREFGPCPATRPQLLAWVDEQLDRCTALRVPGDVAMAMVETGYVEWCAQLLQLDQPVAFGAMQDLAVPDDFDTLAASEIQQLFEGADDAKGD